MLRTKLWYVFLLLFFGLFALLYNEHNTMVIFLVMLILPVFMWIIGMILKRSVDIFLSSDVFVGTKEDPYQITVQLKNHSIFPIPKIKIVFMYRNLFLETYQKEILVTAIDGKKEVSLSLSAHSEYCGINEYKVAKVYLYDYLGLWKFRKKGTDALYVTILPNLTLIETKLIMENANVLVESDVFSSTKSGDDASELFGIREYEQGDKMNRIHWKLSLKQEELMVKQFGLPINCAVAIMVDFAFLTGEEAIGVVDALAESLLSLSVSLIMQEQIHYVIWFDHRIQSCQRIRIEHEEDIYEAIAMMYHCKLYGMEHSFIHYHDAHYGNDQYTNIYYLTATIDEETLALLNQARKSAITRILLVTMHGSVDEGNTALHIESMGMSYTFLREEDIAGSLMEL